MMQLHNADLFSCRLHHGDFGSPNSGLPELGGLSRSKIMNVIDLQFRGGRRLPFGLTSTAPEPRT